MDAGLPLAPGPGASFRKDASLKRSDTFRLQQDAPTEAVDEENRGDFEVLMEPVVKVHPRPVKKCIPDRARAHCTVSALPYNVALISLPILESEMMASRTTAPLVALVCDSGCSVCCKASAA